MLPHPAGLQGAYRDDLRARAAYAEGAGIYRIVPRAVARPADTRDLQSLICWASDNRVSLIPRGAGSAMGGGNVGEGVIVDLTGIAGRSMAVDAEDRRAITAASTTLVQLNSEAKRYGLRLPPDPSSGSWATLGGMVATNAAGARSVRYGSVRAWVRGLTLLTAEGETVTLRRGSGQRGTASSAALTRFDRTARPEILAAAALIATRFPRTRKNSSGYALDAFVASGDVLDLIIGAEGTLGVITEIEWRLDPVPSARAGLRIGLRSLDQLAQVILALGSVQPSALELLDRSFLDLVSCETAAGASLRFSGAEAVLLVELERPDEPSLRDALEEATALARPLAHSVDTAFSSAAAERLWAIRHAASPILARLPEQRRSLQVIEDACVPVERVGDYIRAVRRATAARDIDVVMFGHAGDGHIHVNILPDVTREGWQASIASLLEEITEVVVQLGGTPAGEHGDGRLRAASLLQVYGPEILRLFGLVKESFDPNGLFNPGVILPSGESPISRLKVGSAAAPLPPDIELALREIERTGGYGRSRLELADQASRV